MSDNEDDFMCDEDEEYDLVSIGNLLLSSLWSQIFVDVVW